jgi:hypothetical protein
LKRLPIYPFLFVLEIILIPLSNNLEQLDPSQALRPLGLLLLAAAGGLLLFYRIFKDWHYASYLVFLIGLDLLAFGYLNRAVNDQLARYWKMIDERVFWLVFTLILGILAAKKVWVRLGGRTWLTSYLNLVFALGLLVPAFRLVPALFQADAQARAASQNALIKECPLAVDPAEAPDIYYIVMDAYGRADMLEDLYGLDNQPFLDYLKGKGFYVASESYANYIQTIYSIPSGLNFDYMKAPAEGVNPQAYFSEAMRHSQVMTLLKQCGYHTVAIESGYFFTQHPDVDVYLEHGIGTTELESLLLADSPFDILSKELNLAPSDFSYEAHRQRVLDSFEKLGRLPQMAGPKIVFAHIISPHPPFVFDRSGQPVQPQYSYSLGDGDDYRGSLEEYRSRYPEQVQFANRQLEQVIDSILANSTIPPVIILQGDHGPGSRLSWDAPGQTCLWERTPILNAYYLPGEGQHLLYPSISPVNSFRVVLNAYFGADLPLLPDLTYFSSHRLEREVIDITGKRTSKANCSVP